MTEEQQNIEQLDQDSWDDFAGIYMKAQDVKEWPVVVVCKDVEAYSQDGKPKLDLIVEYNNRDRKIGINATNRNVLKSNKITSPSAIIGKKLTFIKTKVNNPSTGQPVDSFILDEVENTA